ncbi:MAG: histidine--tRNA ligase [Acidimicrobiales bacterium]
MAESPRFRAPAATQDILPPESARWEALLAHFATQMADAGYGLLQSPMFEEIGVFQRVGEGTDVVRKEMYEFTDRGDRRMALRPEGTASVVRAYNQHRPATPWKVWYAAPSFRYERKQAGRYRQHHQLGIEALGSEDPDLDVEVIVLLADFYRSLGLRQVELSINSMGSPADRNAYVDALRTWLRAREDQLDPADREKVADNPMRVLDSKRETTRSAVADAPRIVESLSPEATARFQRVQQGLDAAEITYQIDPGLVRGLDYYTHTTFEFAGLALESAQNALGGGGRYDGLAEALGGPATPGIGFGCGIERTLLACDAEGAFAGPDCAPRVFIVDVAGGSWARDLTVQLRRAGISADRGFDGRSMRAQMKLADRSGARWAIIVGEDEVAAGEVSVRDMHDPHGDQHRIDRTTLIDHLESQA